MRNFTRSALLGTSMLALGGMAMAQDVTIQNAEALTAEANIVENAALVQNFSTLVAAIQAAGLADELMGEGPFTVFAPLDSAFAALPEGTVDDLLLPENRDQLVTLLHGHVVPGLYTSDDFNVALLSTTGTTTDSTLMMEGDEISLTTLGAASLYVGKSGDTLNVRSNVGGAPAGGTGSSIVAADIMSSNGVIHIIDGVLMPPM